jgi:hypothetical protein
MGLRVRAPVPPSSTLLSDIPVVVWVAYAFYAVPVICVLARLHVTAGGK